jgi:hypothetical protein
MLRLNRLFQRRAPNPKGRRKTTPASASGGDEREAQSNRDDLLKRAAHEKTTVAS